MSRKSDLDNHANQRNPNNDEYYQSRGSSRHLDDDEASIGVSRIATPSYFAPPMSVEQGFRFTVVSLTGKFLMIKFSVAHDQGLQTSPSSSFERNLSFAELICDEAARQTGVRWGERQLAAVALRSSMGRELATNCQRTFQPVLNRGKQELATWEATGSIAVERALQFLGDPSLDSTIDWCNWGSIRAQHWTSLSAELRQLVGKLLAMHL